MRYEILDDFITQQEANEIIVMARDKLVSSTTLNPVTGATDFSDFRQSEQMYFGLRENQVITQIEERIAAHTHTRVEQGEGSQVVRYQPGGYFKPHYDAFDTLYGGHKDTLQHGGQRICTCLIYLNDLSPGVPGGETYFPNINLLVKPKMGRALIWWGVKEDGTQDTDTFHEGRPTPPGSIKYIFTKWIREANYS